MAACSRSAWPVASTASSFLILITGALLASNFVLPPLPFQRLVAHRTARAASRGFLLFNAEENQKEKFMLAKLFDLINELPKEFAALDWQPPDSRGTRYFNAMDNKCVQYFAAGREESWSDALKNNFRSRGSGDTSVPLSFVEFVGERLPLEKGSMDVALLQPGAADGLGPRVFRQIFRETSRVLKPKSRFLVFIDASTKLPATGANYFDIERRFKRDTTRCYRLIRKPRLRPSSIRAGAQAEKEVVRKEPKLKRPKPLSVSELESALADEE
ncbi:unnamed protein product [Durusdinium trenchii]|uniref:Methyltransferase type 11 domain-containing protein n=1 Tax=Durusdinium trenchii TaxID=1381693 RepID=A0ABP0QBT8_9DINO